MTVRGMEGIFAMRDFVSGAGCAGATRVIVYAFLTKHFKPSLLRKRGKVPVNLEKKLKNPLRVQNSTRLAERI